MTGVAGPERVPLTRMRRAIAKSMTASAAVPQFTIEMDADVGALLAIRERVQADGGRLALSDVLVAATAAALVRHPDVNTSFAADAIVRHREVNVGIAVALDEGLIVPAIRRADRLSLREIGSERVRLTSGARAGPLTVEDVTSGTFTITNLGPLGATRFRALVLPPQAAILAVGAVSDSGWLTLTLSCGHRAFGRRRSTQRLPRVLSHQREATDGDSAKRLWSICELGLAAPRPCDL